jgi:predicted nuclease with RNAse H fold|tara:strand:- start:453 stop:1091 length:639 start_codon:yes stop_codon:yes gene_type:complete
MSVLGVDLRASRKKSSSVAILDSKSHLTELGSFYEDIELMKLVDDLRPDLVAIGAPLNLPSGFCCLDQSCDCRFSVPDRKGRLLELELAKMGISCFYTNKGSIIRELIYRGILLSQNLRDAGYNVIEVYPHATKMLLFGDKVPPKNSAVSVSYMIGHLTPLVSGMEKHADDLDRNSCDAIINAYTGQLHAQSNTDVLGDPEEGILVLPKLPN